MKKTKLVRLRGRISEKYGTMTAFADAVGLAKQTVSNKLVGGFFTTNDVKRWCVALEIKPDEIPYYFYEEC